MALATVTSGFILKQSAAITRSFYFGTTAQTVTVTLSKNGAAFAAAAGAVSEIASGWYKIALTAVDTNTLGFLGHHCTAASGGPADFQDIVEVQTFSDLSINGNGQAAISSNIKQNAALTGFTFMMTNSSTHSAATGASVTAQRSLAGAGFASCANSVSEISNGLYKINLAAADLNAAVVALRFTASGCDDLNIVLITQP